MILHLDKPELKIYSDSSLHLLIIQACGTVPTDIYRHGLSLATSIAIEEKSFFWLVNNLEGGIVSPADQIWATEVNAPKLGAESFIRKMAFIEPKDLHSKIILENMMDKAREFFPFEMQFFEDVPSAHAWFKDTAATEFVTAVPSRAVAAGRALNS